MEEGKKAVQFDIKEYRSGKLVVQKVGTSFVMVKNQWDKDTGEPTSPLIIPINKKSLENTIESNMKMIQTIEESTEIVREILVEISKE